MNHLIGCCGLDCEKCDARIATINNDDTLRQATAKLWSELNNAPITKDMINCTGCRTQGVKTPFCESICEIRKCAAEKSLSHCGECPRFENCEILSIITANNAEAAKNLGFSSRSTQC